MGSLVAMVGLPRSGKTTYIKKYLKSQGFVSVCPDDVRKAIHGQAFLASLEPFVWATVYAMVDALLITGYDVVVDACNISSHRREPWSKRKATFIEIKTPLTECLRRAGSDAGLIVAINRMCRSYEPVAEYEGEVMVNDMSS